MNPPSNPSAADALTFAPTVSVFVDQAQANVSYTIIGETVTLK